MHQLDHAEFLETGGRESRYGGVRAAREVGTGNRLVGVLEAVEVVADGAQVAASTTQLRSQLALHVQQVLHRVGRAVRTTVGAKA